MDDSGQLILLSALFMCLCLIGVVACVIAVGDSTYRDRPVVTADELMNARWAQESALQRTAIYDSTGTWGDRAFAVSSFKAAANSSAANMSIVLLSHGLSCQFLFNDSLASQYASAHPDYGTENMGGVLVEQSGSIAKIRGCAYDLSIGDPRTSYCLSRIAIFD